MEKRCDLTLVRKPACSDVMMMVQASADLMFTRLTDTQYLRGLLAALMDARQHHSVPDPIECVDGTGRCRFEMTDEDLPRWGRCITRALAGAPNADTYWDEEGGEER